MSDRVQQILSHYRGENPGVLTNLARMLYHGTLAGTGKLVILPVDQGVEHGPARSFAPNAAGYDPDYHFQLAIEAGCNAIDDDCNAATPDVFDADGDTFACDVDCDDDTVLFRVEQVGGAACHTGRRSCFFRKVSGDGLEDVGVQVFDPAVTQLVDRIGAGIP